MRYIIKWTRRDSQSQPCQHVRKLETEAEAQAMVQTMKAEGWHAWYEKE